MNHNFFFAAVAAFCLMFCACSSNDEQDPTQSHEVTFQVSNFQSTTSPMSMPAIHTSMVDGDDGALTDLYLFDGTTELMHQTSSEENFGTITVMLTTGSHTLHFVATRSTGLSYSNGILACTSLRNTFGKTMVLNVGGSSEQNVTLDRLSGKLIITINDAIPTGASNLNIQLGDRYTSLDVATMFGVSSAAAEFNQNISSKVGNTGYSVNLYCLSPDADGYETTFTLTATNASSAVIGQATGTITIAPNTKTLLSGNLFTGTKSFVSLNSAWNADINESF